MTFRKFGDDLTMPLRQDSPVGPPLPAVISDATTARVVAQNSVRSHCGWCSQSWNGHHVPPHKCTDPAGRDLAEVKRAAAEGARRAFRALTNWTPPPCEICGRSYPAGASHDCGHPTELLEHDRFAVEWQRRRAAELGDTK